MLQRVETEAAGLAPAAPVSKSAIRGIAVCGSHPATVARAPFNDASWLIYACSPDNSPRGLGEHAKALPRVDLWFEIHNPVFDKTLPYAYLDWLSTIPTVYMRDRVAMDFRTKDGKPLFPTAVLYPDEYMRGKKIVHPDGRVEFTPGEFHRSQFRSSIAFMMAKAILDCEEQGIKSIGLWGILQRGGKNEYDLQRPSTQYFIEEAMRRGISVSVSPESMLMHDDPELF